MVAGFAVRVIGMLAAICIGHLLVRIGGGIMVLGAAWIIVAAPEAMMESQ